MLSALKKIQFVFLSLLLVAGLYSGEAKAFGLNTHLWIAQQIIDGLDDNCRIQLGREKARFPTDVCQSIQKYPEYFLAGSIGPDGFPDIITGQTVVHPGVDDGWKTSDWLNHLYQRAENGRELAFAAGYLVHAASDTFAHTYVNNYAGDEFSLTDERRVEIRHFVLEKYIDSRLPPSAVNIDKLKVPTKFLRDNLIYNKSAAVNSARSGIALHIPAMYAVKESIGDVAASADDLEKEITRVIDLLIPWEKQLGINLGDQKVDLGFLKEGLKGQETKLALEKEALESAKKSLDDAINELEKNAQKIDHYRNQISSADREIENIRRLARQAKNAIGGLRRVREAAKEARKAFKKLGGSVGDSVCKKISECKDLMDDLNDAIDDYDDARDAINDEAVEIAAQNLKKAAALRKKIEREALKAPFENARRVTRTAYDIANTKYKAELDITVNSRKAVAVAEVSIAVLLKQIDAFKFGKEDLKKLATQLNIISGPLGNWETGVDVASEKFIDTGLVVAKKMAASEEGAVGEYVEWFKCHGVAFMGIPHQLGEAGCFAQNSLVQIQKEIDAFIINSHPDPIRSVIQDFMDLKEEYKVKLKREVETAGIEITKFASPDGTTGDFIELIVRPENATTSKLNEVFQSASDADGKKLLVFDKVSDQVNTDIDLANDVLNPRSFKALDYALKFSQLALMSQKGLERFVWKMGGRPENLGSFQSGKRQSILIETLKSIDGNHQWQPFGLPYPRSTGDPEPKKALERNYGWGPLDKGRKGLSLFIDINLRNSVFLSLFPYPVSGEIINRPELRPPSYKFPSCDRNPFPVAFASDGAPVDYDDLCAVEDSTRTSSLTSVIKRKRFFRKIFSFFGFGPDDR